MSKTKNDLAWDVIFSEFQILDVLDKNDHFIINSSQLNQFRESRLLTKMDHSSQLPKIFSDNKLSILPISRGSYIIGRMNVFENFNQDKPIISPIEFPPFLESINYREITSESTAINCAFVSGILEDFINEGSLYPTVSGRMSSSSFSFKIDSFNNKFEVKVENSQIEIDGGYESDGSLSLIEAKNYISKDFLVRQLYYPYRLWQEKIQKKIRPIFLSYSNGKFHLREYQFDDVNHYNSIRLIRQKKYFIREGNINLETIIQILEQVEIVAEPKIPFPQADNFERVINLCELINQNKTMFKEQYLEDFDFGGIDPRQHDYYTNAARYLGLVKKDSDSEKNIYFSLTPLGLKTISLNLHERQKKFIELILSHKVFNDILKYLLDNGGMPGKDQIVDVMRSSNLYKIGKDSTYYRRASTISGWLNWILDQMED